MGLCNRVLIKEYAQNPCTPLPGLVHESLLHNASSCLPLRAAYAQNTEGGTCNSGRASTKAAGGGGWSYMEGHPATGNMRVAFCLTKKQSYIL